MSDLMREMIPILFMYFCVFLLAPFIGWALWMAFEGDHRQAKAEAEYAASVADGASNAADAAIEAPLASVPAPATAAGVLAAVGSASPAA